MLFVFPKSNAFPRSDVPSLALSHSAFSAGVSRLSARGSRRIDVLLVIWLQELAAVAGRLRAHTTVGGRCDVALTLGFLIVVRLGALSDRYGSRPLHRRHVDRALSFFLSSSCRQLTTTSSAGCSS